MTDEGRIKITLPLPAEECAALGAWLAEYGKVRNAARAEYGKVCDAALAEYYKVRNAARAEYDKVRNAARAECDKACNAALAEYDKMCNAAPLVSWIIENYMVGYGNEVRAVLDALSGGASWADLHDLACSEEWCETWDHAVMAARERFEIS